MPVPLPGQADSGRVWAAIQSTSALPTPLPLCVHATPQTTPPDRTTHTLFFLPHVLPATGISLPTPGANNATRNRRPRIVSPASPTQRPRRTTPQGEQQIVPDPWRTTNLPRGNTRTCFLPFAMPSTTLPGARYVHLHRIDHCRLLQPHARAPLALPTHARTHPPTQHHSISSSSWPWRK